MSDHQKTIQPKPRSHVGWLLLGLVIFAFLFLSYQPVMTLRPDPPLEFLEADSKWGAERRMMEDRAARIYWRLAVEMVQARFPFGTLLPESPPDEFRLNEQEFPRWRTRDFSASRSHHWGRLRSLWSSPQIWQRSYVWNPDRIGRRFVELFMPVRRAAEDILSRFLP
jgi:hypothetical protein